MKNGSSKSSKTVIGKKKPQVEAVDVVDTDLVPHREAPPPPATVGQHLKALDPVPPEAAADPVGWADKHIESLAPASAKELEWALYFGSDQTRREVARDLLAMKGITTKPKETAAPIQAVVLNLGLPVAASGAPVLPFSNAPALDAASTTVTVDATKEPTK
jgi:hypothetical protein